MILGWLIEVGVWKLERMLPKESLIQGSLFRLCCLKYQGSIRGDQEACLERTDTLRGRKEAI